MTNIEQLRILEEQIIMTIKTVEDPEIPVNIYELGLIYDIDIKDEVIWEGSKVHDVEIEMTLTSPNCPVAESLPEEVRTKVSNLANVYNCKVNVVFDPPWDKEYMSEVAQLELGIL
tara:strand:+ start:145 stop:492 length:348 start_codon:yes stop_codon:yes gene_type:complete